MYLVSVILILTATYVHCQINTADCGISKTCYGLPADCVTSIQKPCEMLFTARGHSANKSVHMELEATLEEDRSPFWYAIAFSKDQKMGDDGVFECIFNDDNQVSLRQSYNNGHTNKVVPDGKGTSSVVTRYQNDRIYCSWVQKSPLEMKESTFDVLATPHHLLLAKGPFSRGTNKAYHDKRISSSSPQDLNIVSLIAADASADNSPAPVEYIKSHGCLMIVSWLTIVPVAIMFARYFKESFASSNLCGVRFWFAIHRSFMLAAVICVASASYLSYKFVGGWSGPRLHPILGLATVSLMLLQLITAILRCSPDSSFRWFFNWTHFLTGNVTHITAIAAIFTAYDAITLPPIYLYLVGSYVALHVLTHLIMQARSACNSSLKSESDGSIDMEVSESVQRFHYEAKKDESVAGKICLIAIYVFGVVSISTALVLVIFDRL